MDPGLLDFAQQIGARDFAWIVIAAFASAIFHSISGVAGGFILMLMIAPIIGIKAVEALLD